MKNREFIFAEEFYSKKFKAGTTKDAYMKAVKWVATNVIANNELRDVQIEFEKDPYSPLITVHLFAAHYKEADVMEKHCRACREMHKSFFINEDTHCDRCSARGFQKRLELLLETKTQYYKERLLKENEEY